jgi:conjugal transfer/entry exclusion protein
MQSISEAYKIQVQNLIEADKKSQAKTQATLQRLKSLIETLQSIEFED